VAEGVEDGCHLRHVHRFELGTSYPDEAEDLAETLERLAWHPPTVVVDATGVGHPIVEMLEARGLRPEGIGARRSRPFCKAGASSLQPTFPSGTC